jgi:hypothetical protein
VRGRARLDLEDLESLAEPLLEIPHYDRRKAVAVAAEVSMQLWRRPPLDTDEQLLQRVAIGLGRVVSSGVFFRADKRKVADLIQRKVHLRGGGGGSARLGSAGRAGNGKSNTDTEALGSQPYSTLARFGQG